MSPSRRPKARRLPGAAVVAVAAAVLGGTAWLLWISPLFNEVPRNRASYNVVGKWADDRGLVENEIVRKGEMKRKFPRRWLREERSYWYSPDMGPDRIMKELDGMARPLGLSLKPGPAAPGATLSVILFLPGGREGLILRFAPKVFVAIVIDDIGFNLKVVRRIAALPVKVTAAIIPFTPQDRAAAEMLFSAGKEVFLHMPMEPNYPMPDVPEYATAIKPGMNPAEITGRMEKSVSRLPHITGMNNHEGSVATEQMELMAPVMRVLKKHNLAFVDSGTTVKTVAGKAAHAAGLRWAKRNYFLDISRKKPDVEAAFHKMILMARHRGEAIAIGHPYGDEVTIQVLEEQVPKAIQEGVVFVGVTQLTRVH